MTPAARPVHPLKRSDLARHVAPPYGIVSTAWPAARLQRTAMACCLTRGSKA